MPANGIFLTEKLKTKTKNAQRVENDLIVSTQNSTSRSTSKGMAESFSREKLRHAPQKEGR